ncbi:MAG: rod-binding protein [Anaerovibrio sp.]|nr:rod-binding protein [Anaerovibrio sp.]
MQINSIDGLIANAQQQGQTAAQRAVNQAQGFAQELEKAKAERDAAANKLAKGENKAGEAELIPEQIKYNKKLMEACKGFESMFIQMMYRQMRQTVPENSLFGESQGEKIFRDMLDTQLADNMADAGGLGLAKVIYQQLTTREQADKDMEARRQAALAEKGIHINIDG